MRMRSDYWLRNLSSWQLSLVQNKQSNLQLCYDLLYCNLRLNLLFQCSTLQCRKCITNPEYFSDYESTTWFSFKINKVISSCAMIFFTIFSAQHFKVENASQTRNISQIMNPPRGFLFIHDLPSLTRVVIWNVNGMLIFLMDWPIEYFESFANWTGLAN